MKNEIRPKERREVWVGLFVLFGVLAILTGLFTFTSPAFFRGKYMISTAVANAGGVRRGDSVELLGVAIGRVKNFDFGPNGVLLRLEIEGRYKIPRDSHVEIVPGGLIGGMVVRVVPGESTEMASSDTVLPGAKAQSLTESAERVANESEKTIGRVQELLSEQTVRGVSTSVEQLQVLLTELNGFIEAQRTEVNALTQSLRRSAKDLERVTSAPELDRAIKRLDPMTQKLDEAAASLDRASRSMEVVLGRLERGEGTLGKLSRDEAFYTSAVNLITNVNLTMTDVRLLARDLRLNPKRYVNVSLF